MKDGEIIPKELTLAPGTYTLHESEVPEYEPAQDIVFQVTVDGTVKILRNGNTIGDASLDGNHVTMVDSPSKTNVQFSKVEVQADPPNCQERNSASKAPISKDMTSIRLSGPPAPPRIPSS